MSAPDLTQKVLGFRQFTLGAVTTSFLDGDRTDALLPVAALSTGPWEPGLNRACCAFMTHEAPAHDCTCGLYAMHDPRWFQYSPRIGHAVGAVLAWGRMEVHATGFRAEYAEIVLLGYQRGNAAEIKRAAVAYGVRAVPVHRFEREARKLGDPVPESLRPKPTRGTVVRRRIDRINRIGRRPGPVYWTVLAVQWTVLGACSWWPDFLIAGGWALLAATQWHRYRQERRA